MQKRDYRNRIYAEYGRNFQDASGEFDRAASQRWGRARQYHLRGWLPASKDAHVVDLACGGGKLLHFLVEQGYRNIEGVDTSPDQVAFSRQVVDSVTQGDVIEFLESRPGQFDLITGFDIVEHFHKDEVLRFLDAVHAALRPGGRVILQTPNAGVPWGIHPRYGDFTHETGFNPNALSRLLSLTGFGGIACRECDPPPYGHSLQSSVRFGLWQCIRFACKVRNLIETGNSGDGILTRVFLISATKTA